MNGFYKQFREDLESPLFSKGVYDNFHAFSYLQAISQYHQSNITINSKIEIELGEHELFTSRNKLANIFNWNEHKVSRFLKQLEDFGFIEYRQIGKYGTKIKILKNEREQANEQAEPNIYKGLQGMGEQASEQGVSKQTSKQASKQNPVFTRSYKEQVSKQASKQVSNNIQEVLKNNSVCVYSTPKFSKLVLTDEDYKTGIKLKGKEKADIIFQQMNDYAARTNQEIANPIDLFKCWNIKTVKEPTEPNKPKQKANQNTFNSFNQREYDFALLEKKLLKPKEPIAAE